MNELSDQISKIQEREGIDDLDSFMLGDPDSPEDYQALNIEFEHRLDEIRRDIMKEFDEEGMAGIFWNNRKEYYKRFYSGWRMLEKGNLKMLNEIEDLERADMSEGEL